MVTPGEGLGGISPLEPWSKLKKVKTARKSPVRRAKRKSMVRHADSKSGPITPSSFFPITPAEAKSADERIKLLL